MPWRRSRLLQKYVKSADHAKSAIGTGAPCGPAAPCRAAASRFHIPVFHATFVPHAIPRPPHTWAASPYGIAVSPYNHTPDAFPHTSQQIPIGWSSPHMVSADPPNNTARSKKLILNSTRPADPAPQIPNQPCQANIQNLRYNPANQTPASSSKSHMPATGGCAVTSCTYGHDHACTAMFMPLRVMCTAASTSGHASDETSVRLEHIKRQSNSLKYTEAA